ncbi:MAG: hypothetical protein AB7H97_06565 [Pseudobdellovibrionaceae bacterium]
MDNLLRKIPKLFLVLGVLALGLGLFIFMNPFHTVCDSQIEFFRQSQAGRLYPLQKKTGIRSPSIGKFLENCKLANSPGGCLEYFITLRKLLHDINAVPSQCVKTIADLPEVKSAYLGGLGLIVRLAWGEEPPDMFAKTAWLETPDLALFCGLQNLAFRTMEQEEWANLRGSAMQKLPGIQQFKGNSEEVWQRSHFSLRCESYQ